ncbi:MULTISPECIES: bifunctional 2-polyprenyl-6-hydroxyphenol methylase/3-demethylubiquinol 3-O-methyltransferase UbiG [unclassified Thioalkalivibrio]|uniref:class I SAM-dependent methyltransferase n=1 Tax=unclassified Thioalkalivibrio TaxID=2621013 RepID=UPI00068727F6|nr:MULTISPECIES: class I SAM-dependent methyltransferase [unclassified Thioalkalivibrio]
MGFHRATKRVLRTAGRCLGFIAQAPYMRRKPQVDPAPNVAHGHWLPYLVAQFDRPGAEILEIGSRNVTGLSPRSSFHHASYTGFDFYEGDNVDVQGDAHRLSEYFADSQQFDLVFCNAVFEHLHMPWLVVSEINNLLRPGGHVFVETHFSFPSHERPWHFFHFTDMGLRALFNSAVGFEVLESGMSNPLIGHYRRGASTRLRYRPLLEMYAHSEILARKVADAPATVWNQAQLDPIVGHTRYPEPSSVQKHTD